jgi:xylulokinase
VTPLRDACPIGLDVGTTTCRAVAFDCHGQLLAEARREVVPEHPAPGEATQQATRWWEAACLVLREVVATLEAQGRAPLAVGLAGLMHAMVPLDARLQPVAPAMLWMDQRSQTEVDWLNGEGRQAFQAAAGAGALASTTPSLARLRWIAANEPQVLARTRWLLLPKDYVRLQLTGQVATDPTDAGGTGLYDGRAGNWSPGLVELARITPEQLPPIRPSASLAGGVTPAAAQATGLPAGLPVVVGMADTAATRLGSLGTDREAALIYMGTAAWVNWSGRGNHHAMLATTATGGALRWLRDVLSGPGEPLPYDTLLAEAAATPAGADGALFLPHLSGERGPVGNPAARGVFSGLALCHGRGHLVRALLEGTSCHIRWLMEEGQAMEAPRIHVSGGGTRGDVWTQVLANVLDRPLQASAVAEAGALGAAMLAATGVGRFSDLASAATAMLRPGRKITPQSELRELHAELYRRWRLAEESFAPPCTRGSA